MSINYLNVVPSAFLKSKHIIFVWFSVFYVILSIRFTVYSLDNNLITLRVCNTVLSSRIFFQIFLGAVCLLNFSRRSALGARRSAPGARRSNFLVLGSLQLGISVHTGRSRIWFFSKKLIFSKVLHDVVHI